MKTLSKTQEIKEKIKADRCVFENEVYIAKWFDYCITDPDKRYINFLKNSFPNSTIIKTSKRWTPQARRTWFEIQFTL